MNYENVVNDTKNPHASWDSSNRATCFEYLNFCPYFKKGGKDTRVGDTAKQIKFMSKYIVSFIELSPEFCHLLNWKAETIPYWKRAEKYLFYESWLSSVSSWTLRRIQSVQGLCLWMKRMSAHDYLARIFQTCLVQWVPVSRNSICQLDIVTEVPFWVRKSSVQRQPSLLLVNNPWK